MFQTISSDDFLRDYFGQKWLKFSDRVLSLPEISKAEVIKAAQLSSVVSRTITHLPDEPKSWVLEYGPFTQYEENSIPKTNWTMLVQKLNFLLPEGQCFLNQFNFLPRWALDDLMVSIASPGGGVGPHYDRYDVFLIQVYGNRKWRLQDLTRTNHDKDFVEGLDVKILKNFEPDAELVCEPGDVLYLPPGVAHDGVAIDDCMTLSVGFKRPSFYESLAFLLENISESDLVEGIDWFDFGTVDFTGANRKEISQKLLSQVQKEWQGNQIEKWLTSDPLSFPEEFESTQKWNKNGKELIQIHPSRKVIRDIEHSNIYFVNGQKIRVPDAPLVKKFMEYQPVLSSQLSKDPEIASWFNSFNCS